MFHDPQRDSTATRDRFYKPRWTEWGKALLTHWNFLTLLEMSINTTLRGIECFNIFWCKSCNQESLKSNGGKYMCLLRPLSKACDCNGGLESPEANQIICFIDTIFKSLISVLSGLYGWSLLQVNYSYCQLFLWQVLLLQKSWLCAQMQPGSPTASKCFFFPPASASPRHYMVSLCSHHYNNRIHKTEHRNKGITYWQLMKHRKIVQAV